MEPARDVLAQFLDNVNDDLADDDVEGPCLITRQRRNRSPK